MQALLGESLPVIKSELGQTLDSRAYTFEQIEIVASAQTFKHALSTEIAASAGLRAHELLTLLPASERHASIHRTWREERFSGHEDIRIYTVAGKGGLVREVAIDCVLAGKLEERRLDEPRTITDRGIYYLQHYDIGGGKQWSDSFSKAAERELGWTTGAHGVRHTYAQERMRVLQFMGYNYRAALELISQEMGHFRPEISEVYLR